MLHVAVAGVAEKLALNVSLRKTTGGCTHTDTECSYHASKTSVSIFLCVAESDPFPLPLVLFFSSI